MLLLFTSGSRPRYIEDVLDILNLPDNASTTIQYSYLSDTNTPYIEGTAMPENCVNGEEILFIFINRDDPDNPQYIPLRRGHYIDGELREGMVYYTVGLGEVCSIDNIKKFSAFLKTVATDSLYFHYANGKRKGYYVFRISDGVHWDIENENMSWRTTIKQIAECECFKKIFPIFTRFCLYETGQPQQVIMKQEGTERFYRLQYKHHYTAKIDYFIPDADKNPSRVTAHIKIGVLPDCLESATPSLNLGAAFGMVEYAFRVKGVSKNLELRYGDVEKTGCDQTLFIASRPIAIKCVRSIWRWVLIGGIVLLMFVCDFLDKYPVDKIIEGAEKATVVLTNVQKMQLVFAKILDNIRGVYPAFVSMIKSGLTFVLVLLFGKSDK